MIESVVLILSSDVHFDVTFTAQKILLSHNQVANPPYLVTIYSRLLYLCRHSDSITNKLHFK